MPRFDSIVIGTGQAGPSLAVRLARTLGAELELRMEGTNVLNHPSFYVGDQNINVSDEEKYAQLDGTYQMSQNLAWRFNAADVRATTTDEAQGPPAQHSSRRHRRLR